MLNRLCSIITCAGVLAVSVSAASAQPPTASRETAPRGTAGAAVPRPVGDTAMVQSDYHIAAGDKLRIEVYKDPQLSQSLQVRPDGKITMPLLGDMPANGLTPIELRDRIATSLKEYVTNPVVTVIVTEAVPPVVYVMGEVTNPGAITLQGPLTVVQALAMAGGFKDFANTKNIKVLRKTANGVQSYGFNYKEAIKSEDKPMYLQPGDTVIVP
jgi:polysaccharide biosynthesis/export protein